MTVKRLFIGTFLSSQQQELLAHLQELDGALRELWCSKLRWVNLLKLHTTWLFLGDVDVDCVSALKSKMDLSLEGYRSGQLIYDKIEFWSSAVRPRQLVMTSSAVPEAISQLSLRIRDQLGEFVKIKDNRDFRPHITLLRFGNSFEPLKREPLYVPHWLEVSKFLPLVQEIKEVALVESQMLSGNSYQIVQSFQLGTQ